MFKQCLMIHCCSLINNEYNDIWNDPVELRQNFIQMPKVQRSTFFCGDSSGTLGMYFQRFGHAFEAIAALLTCFCSAYDMLLQRLWHASAALLTCLCSAPDTRLQRIWHAKKGSLGVLDALQQRLRRSCSAAAKRIWCASAAFCVYWDKDLILATARLEEKNVISMHVCCTIHNIISTTMSIIY